MDELKTAIFYVRNGRTTDYLPTSSSEVLLLDYYRASHAVHVGNLDLFDKILHQHEWQPMIARTILEAKRIHYTLPAKSYVEKIAQIETQISQNKKIAPFWQIEALGQIALAAELAENFDKAKNVYLELEVLCQVENDRQKRAESLANLGVYAVMEGKLALARSYLSILNRDCPDPVCESWILARMSLATDDLALAMQVFESVSSDDNASITLEDGTIPLMFCYETAVRLGEWDKANQIWEKLRLGFARYPLRHPTTHLMESKIARALRVFSPDLGELCREALSQSGLWGKGRMLALIAQAMDGFRHEREDIERRQEELLSISPEMNWTWIRQTAFFIARKALLLKLGGFQDYHMLELQDFRSQLVGKGRLVEARDAHFFEIEVLLARGEIGAALSTLEAWTKDCELNNFYFDRDLGRSLLQRWQDQSSPENKTSFQAMAQLAVENLSQQWPWSLVFAKPSESVTVSAAKMDRKRGSGARLRLASRLLEELVGRNSEVMTLDEITLLLWNEDFDPFIHPNRIYQVIVDCREILVQEGLAKDSIRSHYGNGYIYEAVAVNLGRASGSLKRQVLTRFHRGERLSVEQIAKEHRVTMRHSRRTLRELVKAGLVEETFESGEKRFFSPAKKVA